MKVRKDNLAAFLDNRRGIQAKIARECGIAASVVAEWKKGKRTVPLEHLPTLCRILGCSEADLCEPFSAYAQRWMNTDTGKVLLRLFPNLTDSGLDQVLKLALELQPPSKEQ